MCAKKTGPRFRSNTESPIHILRYNIFVCDSHQQCCVGPGGSSPLRKAINTTKPNQPAKKISHSTPCKRITTHSHKAQTHIFTETTPTKRTATQSRTQICSAVILICLFRQLRLTSINFVATRKRQFVVIWTLP